MVFWVVTLSPVNWKHWKGTWCLHLQGHSEWGIRAVRLYWKDDNDGCYPEKYRTGSSKRALSEPTRTVNHKRRENSSCEVTESRLVRNIPFNGSGRGMTKQLFEGKLWTVSDKNNSLKGQTVEGHSRRNWLSCPWIASSSDLRVWLRSFHKLIKDGPPLFMLLESNSFAVTSLIFLPNFSITATSQPQKQPKYHIN